jgi:hypothetical protein
LVLILCVEGEQANESLVSFAVTCVAARVATPQSLELGGVLGAPGKLNNFLVRELAMVPVGTRRTLAHPLGEMLSVESSKLF